MDLDVVLPEASYATIGRIANSWAKIEFSADLMNTVIFMRYEANRYEKRIPVALESKLRFLRRAMNRIPALAPYKAETLSFVDGALMLRNARHAMIHGVARSHGPEGTTYIHLANKNDSMDMREGTYTDEDVVGLATASDALATQAYAVCKRFIDYWIEESQKTVGEFPRSKHRVFLPRLKLALKKFAEHVARRLGD